MKIKYLTLFLFLSSMFVLTSCDNILLETVKDDIIITFNENNNSNFVTKDLVLETNFANYNLSDFKWSSSHPNIITELGEVIRPFETTNVEVTATFTFKNEEHKKTFVVKVIGLKEYQVTILGLDEPLILYANDFKELTIPNLNKEGFTYKLLINSGEEFDPTNLINGPLTLTIVYEPTVIITYNITYILYGDNIIPNDHIEFIPSILTFSNNSNNLLEIPNDRKSEIFIGWMYENEIITKTPNVSEDITLVAIWELKTYIVTTNNDGEINNYHVNHSHTLSINTPTKTGYDFIGWMYEEDGIQKLFTKNTIVNKNMNLVATWQKQ